MNHSEIFENLIIDFSIFLFCIETNILQSIQEKIQNFFVKKFDLKRKYHEDALF